MSCGTWMNSLFIGTSNYQFQTDDNDDGVGMVTHSLTQGETTWDALRNDFLTQAQTDIASLRMGILDGGRVVIDNNGGGNFRIVFGSQALATLFGFKATTLTGSNFYNSPRRIGGCLWGRYLNTNQDSPMDPSIEDFDPMPGLPYVSQTESLGGVTRTTRSGVQRVECPVGIRFLDNSARLVSQAFYFTTGDDYASAVDGADGLTLFQHARDIWYDSTNPGYQGWSDGRPVRYFADPHAAAITTSAAQVTYTSTDYTTWVFTEESCRSFPARKARPPKSHLYHLDLKVREYVAP